MLGVDLETLRPEPTVEGHSTPGGYSGPAIRPIALRMGMEVAQVIRHEFPGRSLSGIGGIETGGDVAQFLLLGADTVQVCTGVMKFGYRLIKTIEEELEEVRPAIAIGVGVGAADFDAAQVRAGAGFGNIDAV